MIPAREDVDNGGSPIIRLPMIGIADREAANDGWITDYEAADDG